MPHQAHLFSLRIGHALQERLAEGYNRQHLLKDILAGVVVGIIAIPLAMALAIASGVPPQYGLYTAIVGGFLIALTGGSRLSVSGPTAAFVVILAPISHQYGLAGLMIATVLAGFILVGMAVLRIGRLIQYIPESVTLGFTAGIAVVIATLQVKDFLALTTPEMPAHYMEKVVVLTEHISSLHLPAVIVGSVTLLVLILWPRVRNLHPSSRIPSHIIPAHLVAVIIAGFLAVWLNRHGYVVDTIGSRFFYTLPDGNSGHGIPPVLPHFTLPWQQSGPEGSPLVWSWPLAQALFAAAFAIAMLGAIESLLCAVVLDNMTGKRHSANSELLGQGIGNIVAPFFGGIPSTAAIARSAANLRTGAQSPLAAMVHAGVILLALVAFAPLLSYLPMPAVAGMLIIVAWNIAEAPKIAHLLKTASLSDILIFLACFLLTVIFDMVIAITAGIVLACLLFVKQMAEMTHVSDITSSMRVQPYGIKARWKIYKINGPLFFAAADRIFGELALLCHQDEKLEGITLYLDGVPLLDAGGIAALGKLMTQCEKENVILHLADLQTQPRNAIQRAHLIGESSSVRLFPTLHSALHSLHE